MILITGALAAEHRMFCAVFDQIGEALPKISSLLEIKRLARLVEGLLLRHAQTEDDLLQLVEAEAQPGKSPVSRIKKEHQEMDARITRVYVSKKVVLARSLLTSAMSASRKHFHHEERSVFPWIEKVLAPETLSKLGTIWFLRKHAPANWTV